MLKTYLTKAIALFFILGFVFVPLTFFGLNLQYQVTRFLFLRPVTFLQNHFFKGAISNADFSSDTVGLNILMLLLLILAFLSVWLLDIFKVRPARIVTAFKSFSACYVALVLLKYGFDKLFKQQFYLPEPNILYANFGSLTKDTLYWSTMGLSHTYSVSLGIIEIMAGVLLLMRPTRILGFCLATGIITNILLINFSFDISVKTFSAFLLAAVLCNIYPYGKVFYNFFIVRRPGALPPLKQWRGFTAWAIVAFKLTLIGLVLAPYILAGNFNDDKAERPLLHGAYSIERFSIAGDTLNKSDFPYKRFFIHRNNYIIFQQQDDSMADYFFEINPVKKQLKLIDYQKQEVTVTYDYAENTGLLTLKFGNNKHWVIESSALNWKGLPALQGGMHYTIDEVK